MPLYFDAHTHKKNATNAIVNIRVGVDEIASSMHYFSAGIHPYDVAKADEIYFETLETLASHVNCVAIGECGIDKRYANVELQIEIFCKQVALAQKYHKPLIIHCVRAQNEILKATAKFDGKIVFHAYASYSPQEASYPNILFSVGEKQLSNHKLLKIPFDRLLAETDDSQMPIDKIYETLAAKFGSNIVNIINQNFHNTFNI